ncbi:TRP-domain-containing protein [Rhizodiscina lignyota]|uniref:TRP-domain-containing protein n=1 Tax=Rhizodiscina lignyota TaxID=1504668 RepID=A0A9P4IHW0_9PEZI|nr:TRP-domain-containing protein [Rhizodiscina lignyota]
MIFKRRGFNMLSLLLLSLLPAAVSADQVLKTDGFASCANSSAIQVQKMNIQYNKASNKVTFDVAGTSEKEQKVRASLIVTAYGKQVYENDFNPCDEHISQLCPLPKGNFEAQGEQSIPAEFVSKIPSIAFSIPNLDGMARLELRSVDDNSTVACIESTVDNGKTLQIPAISYVAAGIAGAALLLSGLSALSAAGEPGTPIPSPSFGDVVGWFQNIAMNGMLSVQYPKVYQSFSQNFAFSGLLINWDSMQTTIDNFRSHTGGNLTDDSVPYLHNATLVSQGSDGGLSKRALDTLFLIARDTISGGGISASNGTDANQSGGGDSKIIHFVHGIQAYVEQLTIPQSNTFMTVLLIFSIVIAAIIVGILLFKVILETWSLFGTFPNRLTGFRKHYWWLMAKTITNLILLLYGVWTLYCVYQFTNGDSWAAKVLAGVTLGIFTLVLFFFTFRIWQGAHRFKKLEGNTSAMYEDKEFWRKYSLFYENYKKSYWWLFVPAIIYMFAKGCVIAGGDGHGLVQTAGQLVIESVMLILLLWTRPFSLKSSNWINCIIQVVRVLSVVCILVFVEELGISQTTKTITGVVLIVTQSVLTGLLAILLVVNSIVVCCKENPHRRRRKEAGSYSIPSRDDREDQTNIITSEKYNRDLDNLTPLDARNSLLLNPTEYKGATPSPMTKRASLVSPNPLGLGPRGYDRVPNPDGSRDLLLGDAASMGAKSHTRERSASPDLGDRIPTLPDVESGGYQRRY